MNFVILENEKARGDVVNTVILFTDTQNESYVLRTFEIDKKKKVVNICNMVG